MEVVSRLGLHPRGEAFVQPELIPPRHGHQVAEPLVGHLVGDGGEHLLAVGLGGQLWIDQQGVVEVENRPPVLHGREELAVPGPGHQIELGQRVRRVEVAVVEVEQLHRGVQGVLAARGVAPPRDHADLGLADHLVDALEVAEREEQQVGAHLRAVGELHRALAVGLRPLARDRHVGDRHLAGRRVDGEREDRLHARLVPNGCEAARVGVFELSEKRPLLAAGAVVVQREQARGLLVDLAGVVDRQLVAPRRQRLGEHEGGGLLFVVQHRAGRGVALKRHLLERQVGGVQHNPVGRAQHGELDGLTAGEGEVAGVRPDVDLVPVRPYVGGQDDPRRGRGALGFGGRTGHGGSARHEQDGGEGGKKFHRYELWAAKTKRAQ